MQFNIFSIMESNNLRYAMLCSNRLTNCTTHPKKGLRVDETTVVVVSILIHQKLWFIERRAESSSWIKGAKTGLLLVQSKILIYSTNETFYITRILIFKGMVFLGVSS